MRIYQRGLASMLLAATILITSAPVAVRAEEQAASTAAGSVPVELESEQTVQEGEASAASESEAPLDRSASRPAAGLSYEAHASGEGWLGAVAAGDAGDGAPIEAVRATAAGAAVEARGHVSQIGWQRPWSAAAGTTGRGLALEAVELRLPASLSSSWDLWYRVRAAGGGWTGWASNGDPAGTQGEGLALTGVELRLLPRGSEAPGPTEGAFRAPAPSVSARAHVSRLGWLPWAAPGAWAGTTGRSLPMEAVSLALSGAGPDDAVSVDAHVSDVGWMGAREGGGGTTGLSRRLEAVRISLSGPVASTHDVWYRAHVAGLGWLGWASDGAEAGSQGLSAAVEALEVRLLPKGSAAPGHAGDAFRVAEPQIRLRGSGAGRYDATADQPMIGALGKVPLYAVNASLARMVDRTGSIELKRRSMGRDWDTSWTAGKTFGDESARAPFEGLMARLTGQISDEYDLWYRAGVGGSWLGWAKNGAQVGSHGTGTYIEALQFALVKKGEAAPGSESRAWVESSAPLVSYQTHSDLIGWTAPVFGNDATGGTTGRGLGMQAIRVAVSGISARVNVQAHVADVGWQGSAAQGVYAGTVGQGRAIQAVRLSLSGTDADGYDIWYRLHVSGYGWLGWAKNGESAGTTGLSKNAEAIQIRLVRRGAAAPSSSGPALISLPSVTYQAHSSNVGWGGMVPSGATAGATGVRNKVEAYRLNMSSSMGGGVSYSAHVADVGWMNPVGSGGVAGTVGRGKQVEAVRMSLTGNAATYFDIWYRVHVQDLGWLGWARNGQVAGTTSCGLRVEAMQVVVTAKNAAAPGSTRNASYAGTWSLPYVGYQNPSWLYQVSHRSVNIKYQGSGVFGYRTESRIPFNATRNQLVNAMVTRAMEYMGTPYRWDYSSWPGAGVDCAGLVMQSLYATGMDLSPMNPWDHYYTPGHDHYANDMRYNGRLAKVSFADRKPGDLILTQGHVSIYLGNDRIIEAYPPRVRISSVYEHTPVLSVARPIW